LIHAFPRAVGLVLFLAATGRGLVPGALAQEEGIRFVHDPCIAQEGGYAYVFSTGEGILIRRSRDLFTWERVGRVFDTDVPAWARQEVPGATSLWAPDVSRSRGEYRLYYVAANGTHCCIGLATNTTLDPARPDYRWVDRGKVFESFEARDDFHAIDPNLVVDEVGQPWLAFGSVKSGIKLLKIDPETGGVARDDRALYSLAARPPGKGIEAPFIVRKEGAFYLFVSFDRCCAGAASDYNIRVGRSRHVTGPYLDRRGRPMLEEAGTPVLASYERFHGPGHCAVLLRPEGDLLVHHYYDAEEHGTPKLQVRPLYWAEDGFPLAGEPITGPPSAAGPASDLARCLIEQRWSHSADAHPAPIQFLPDGTLNRPGSGATWTLRGSELTLRSPFPAAPGGYWLDQCVVAPDGQSYTGRNQLDSIIRGITLGK